MVIFLVALIYIVASFYVGYNGWVWLKTTRFSKYRRSYWGIVLAFTALFLAAFYSPLASVYFIGMLWAVIVGYGLILLPLINLAVFFLKKRGIFWFGISFFAFLLFVVIYGSYNAWNPVIRDYTISIDKPSTQKELKVFVASDLHMGTLVGKNHVQRLVNLVERTKPDLVLLPGDLVDDHIEPYLEKNLGETLQKVKAPLGVYAVPGNHDYYGEDLDNIIREMNMAGIKVLMDESVLIKDAFYLIGRKDLTDDRRQKVGDIVHTLDKTKPMLMMDHTPINLDEAKNNGIDLQLSGHTHRGQLAPAHFITDWLYENDWGYLKKGSFHSLVSSGFGTWGPPFRLGSRSEVLMVHIQFE